MLLSTPLAALADWDATAADTATAARALVLPAGPVPTAVARASTVTIRWKAVSAGVPVRGYRVVRTDAATGETVRTGSGCSGLLRATGCREAEVPDGRWQYGIVTVVGTQWTSAPGVGALTSVETAQLIVSPSSGADPTTPVPGNDDRPPTGSTTPAPSTKPASPVTATPVPGANPAPADSTPSRTPAPGEKPSSTTAPVRTPAATAHPADSAEPTNSAEPSPSAEPTPDAG